MLGRNPALSKQLISRKKFKWCYLGKADGRKRGRALKYPPLWITKTRSPTGGPGPVGSSRTSICLSSEASCGSATVSETGSGMGLYTNTGLVSFAALTCAVLGLEAGPAGSVLQGEATRMRGHWGATSSRRWKASRSWHRETS